MKSKPDEHAHSCSHDEPNYQKVAGAIRARSGSEMPHQRYRCSDQQAESNVVAHVIAETPSLPYLLSRLLKTNLTHYLHYAKIC